jgi:uncharacterized protein (TIGR00375 family)
MQPYYTDLHIHIGRGPTNRPIKITGSKTLTIDNILLEASERKGIEMIGVIDAHVPEVLDHLANRVSEGDMAEDPEGGLHYKNTTLILGTEIEVKDDRMQGPAHVLAYMPDIRSMKAFSTWLSDHMTNIHLSTQRFFGSPVQLQRKVKELNGLFIAAHIFTPFKGIYGTGVKKSLVEALDPGLIDAVELGLSADTSMAVQISELERYTFVTNSDAHSLAKIGREYQEIMMAAPTFKELGKALKNEDGRFIKTNYGLNPKLGKYHHTCCAACLTPIMSESPQTVCPVCGNKRIIKGVFNRLQELKNVSGTDQLNKRPAYVHQVPLEFIPKLGPKTLDRLLDYFGTEMNILHHVPVSALEEAVSESIARHIYQAREGKLSLTAGGAGQYGKVKTDLNPSS